METKGRKMSDCRDHGHGAMYRRAYWPNEGQRGSPKTYSPTPEEYKKAIDPAHVDRCGRTALHLAIMQDGDDELLLKRIIKAGCDVNAADNDGHRGVHYASEKGFARCLQELVKNTVEVNVLNNYGYSPLMLAARHGYPKVVRILMRAGADPNLQNDKNEQALHYAVCKGQLECVQDLIACRGDVNHANVEGTTPCMYAIRFQHTDILRCLVIAGANLNQKDLLGRTALHWVATGGTVREAKVLLDANAQVDTFDVHGQSPFLYTIQTNNYPVLRLLLDAGCDSSTVDGLNGTALALASLKGHTECVRVLLEKDDDPDEVGFFGLTPLMSAAFESHVGVVQTLLEHGADPNVAGRLGATPLIKCLVCVCVKNEKARHKIAAMMIRAGADVNARVTGAGYFTSLTNGKNCPLSFAICNGYVSLVRMLLTAGSTVACDEIRAWNDLNNIDRFYDKKSLMLPLCEWKHNPKSLMHLCRLTIRKSLHTKGLRMKEDIAKLPIAPALKQYVDFSDLEQIEPQRAEPKNSGTRDMLSIQPARMYCTTSLRAMEGTFLHQTYMEGQV